MFQKTSMHICSLFSPLQSPASPLLGADSVELDVHDVRAALKATALNEFFSVIASRYLTISYVFIYSLNVVVFPFSVDFRPLKLDGLALCNFDRLGGVMTAGITRGVVGRRQNSTLWQALFISNHSCETK